MEFITLTKADQLALITLNRPQKYNSFNRQMALELQAVLDDCRDDENIRAIYLTGNGKAFCSGQDLQEVTAEDGPSVSTILHEHFNPIILRLRRLEKPVVCGVNGVAAGAGASIALACDITVAAESAAFIQAFCKIGLVPDSGATYFLPRLLGRQQAAAIMMLGDPISGKVAAELGLIYKAFPDQLLDMEAKKIAVRLAHMPTKALGWTKQAINASQNTQDLEKQLVLEVQLQTAAGLTLDYQEGVRAFLEKREAVFQGR